MSKTPIMKYRVWSKITGRYLMPHEKERTLDLAGDGKLKDFVLEDLEFEYSLLQLDKSDNEIFVGDKIKYDDGMSKPVIGYVEIFCHNFVVNWIDNPNATITSLLFLGCKSELEIIGNVHKDN